MKKHTYTATFDDNGEVIFEHRNRGTRYDLFPKGSQMKSFTETGDGWNGAHGVTPSGRAFTVRRDNAQQPISAPCKPVASVSGAGTGKEARWPKFELNRLIPDEDKYVRTIIDRGECLRLLMTCKKETAARAEQIVHQLEQGSIVGVEPIGSNMHFSLYTEEDRVRDAAPALLRGCQAALAYLADPPSEFAENRAAAVEIIRAALAAATESEGA